MANVCTKCETWREEQYWNDELQSIKHHFFKVLLGDYQNELRIPRKFMNEFKGELLSEVNLRGPSGNVWTTKLVREENHVFLRHGWEVFAKDHGLSEADFLVFEYSEKSSFNVLIFDPTGCEREGCYYVDRNLNTTTDTRHCCSIREAANRHINVNEVKIMHDEEGESQNHDVSSANKFSSSLNRSRSRGDSKKHRIGVLVNEQCSEELSDKLEYLEEHQEDQTLPFSGKEFGGRNLKGYQIRHLISSRRCITRDEEMAVLKKAKEQFESSNKKDQSELPCWIIAMKPSHTIPKKLADLYLPKKSQVIELRVTHGEKTWQVQFKRWKCQCTLNKGWVDFVLDNNLEVSDVCVLAPSAAGRSSGLTVSIYRVVKDIVELKVL